MPVSYEKRGAIGIVTLSRPQARNAWGPDFNEGLARHFAAMEDDEEIRCAILTGDEAGGAFSAGANLKDPRTHTQDSAAERVLWVFGSRRLAPAEKAPPASSPVRMMERTSSSSVASSR